MTSGARSSSEPRGPHEGLDALFARVEVLLMDVDGVLTDGGLYYLDEGSFAVRFDVRDGMGLARARRAGLTLGIISGRVTPQARRRAEELGFAEIHFGVSDKGARLGEIITRQGWDPKLVAYIGDDLVDLPVMRLVGLPVAVADAVEEVREAARYVTKRPGGRGALRELVDRILAARPHGAGEREED